MSTYKNGVIFSALMSIIAIVVAIISGRFHRISVWKPFCRSKSENNK